MFSRKPEVTVFGFANNQLREMPNQQQQKHQKHQKHAHGTPKGLPAPTVTGPAANPYAMVPFSGTVYNPYAAQQQTQQQSYGFSQHAPTVVNPQAFAQQQAPTMTGYSPLVASSQLGSGVGELNQVYPNLWIGSCRALQPSVLASCGIRNVINTAKELKKGGIDWAGLKRAGVVVMHVPWEDNFIQQIFPSKALNDAIAHIDQIMARGEHVLVNCAMGRSRSTSLALAYLIIRKGMTYDQALAQAQSKRPICQPNQMFEQQLRNVENSVRMKNNQTQSAPNAQAHHHHHHGGYSAQPKKQLAGPYVNPYGAPVGFGYGYTPQQHHAQPQQAAWGWAGTGVGAMW
jgi:atypical dual specificity phosphatase